MKSEKISGIMHCMQNIKLTVGRNYPTTPSWSPKLERTSSNLSWLRKLFSQKFSVNMWKEIVNSFLKPVFGDEFYGNTKLNSYRITEKDLRKTKHCFLPEVIFFLHFKIFKIHNFNVLTLGLDSSFSQISHVNYNWLRIIHFWS